MSGEIDCEQIYPSIKNRPSICGLCKTVPEAGEQICEARCLIDQTLKGAIKLVGNKQNVTKVWLRAVLGEHPVSGKRQGLYVIVFEYLINVPVIQKALDSGELTRSRIGQSLWGLVDFNLNLLNNNSNNNGARSLATYSENSHRFSTSRKIAPFSNP